MLMWRIIPFHKKSLYKSKRGQQVLIFFIHFFRVLHSLHSLHFTHLSCKVIIKVLTFFSFHNCTHNVNIITHQTALYGLKMILKIKASKAYAEIHVYHITSPPRNRFILLVILEKKDCFMQSKSTWSLCKQILPSILIKSILLYHLIWLLFLLTSYTWLHISQYHAWYLGFAYTIPCSPLFWI